MKSYPPYKIFLNFALVFLCIILIFLSLPGDKYQLEYLIGGEPGRSGNYSGRTVRPPEISGVVDHPLDNIILEPDSLIKGEGILYPDFVNQKNIEYPDGNTELFLPLVEAIRAIKENQERSKIVYFGDSQLEGDRITGFFRARLRQEYFWVEQPDLLGSIERPGVIVESNSQRGSAGLQFRNDSMLLLQYLSGPYPALIILQFGINVVPAGASDFSYYRNSLIREINYIKKEAPGVPVLIVGVSDMGRMRDGSPRAYASVEKVARAQYEAARETGSAYYDLLGFMGGPGSFINWVEANPSLMRSDFTHFSIQGGAIMANGLAEALIAEVDRLFEEEENGD